MEALIAGLVFLTVSSLAVAVYSLLWDRNRMVARRLAMIRTTQVYTEPERDEELARSFWDRVARPALSKLGFAISRLTPQAVRDSTRRKLAQAGNPWKLQASDFLAVEAVMIVAFGALGFFLTLKVGLGKALFSAMLLSVAGGIVPDLMLVQAKEKRTREIQKTLPDVLDLLTVSVEAGLGFDSAMAKVVEKQRGPLAEELGRVLQDIRVGKSRREALRDLANRTTVDDLAGFAAAVIQADQLGVSIGNILRIQSDQMRTRRRQRAEEAAMKAPIKILIPLVFFIFPTLFVVLLGPAAIQLIRTFAEVR